MLKLPLISHEMPHDLHDYVLTDAQTAGEYICLLYTSDAADE